MNFEDICNWVVLISATLFAIKNILNWIGKPFGFFKKKQDEELKEKVNAYLEEKLPLYFEERDKQTREKYLAQRINYLNEIQSEVTENVSTPIEEINKNIAVLKEAVEVLKQGTKDVLRQKIMDIYHEYKSERKFPIYVKEKLDELYKDYKREGGNSYIDKYYDRMSKWDIEFSEDEDDDEI